MEGLKETGAPNLISADGSTLRDFENTKRGEILEHIQSNRKERDTKLKKASSLKTKIKGLLGNNEGQVLASQAEQIERNLQSDVPWKHRQLREDLERQTRTILQETIKDPIHEINNFYQKKRNLKADKWENGTEIDELSLKIEQEKVQQTFKQENLRAAFADKDLRDDLLHTFRGFFDGRQNNAIYEGIERPDTYSFEQSKGFPIDVAHSILTGLEESAKKDGIESIEDNPQLFRMLNNIAFIYPDGFKGEHGKVLVDIFLERGMNLRLGQIVNLTSLIEVTKANGSQDRFNTLLESKLDAICAKKNWDELGWACLSYSKDVAEPAKKRLETELTKFGLAFADIERAWDIYPASGDSSFMNVPQNLEKMEKLEEQRPGIVRTLFSEFGIKEFRRYPVDALVKQFDDREKDEPYGVVLFTNRDHNQSFDMRSGVIESVFKQTGEHGLGMRITEFESRYEIMKRFANLNDKYGEKNKISYLFLGAHGEEDSFSVTHTKEVNKKDLNNEGVKRLKDYFVENPEIVMASCSTGAENGIGQKISETFGATVHAPNKPTNVREIDVSFGEDNKPHFKVAYADDVLRTYDMGIKK